MHTSNGSGSAQKVSFGNAIWYIAGADSDGSLILMSAPGVYGSKAFHSDGYTNTYSDSEIRDYLNDNVLNNFKTQEKELMKNPSINTTGSVTTSDKLHLASGVENENEIMVGMNDTKIGLYGNGTSGSPYTNNNLGDEGKFWLRSPESFMMFALVAYAGGYDGNTESVKNLCVNYLQAVVPACDLDISKVLFASTATAASASSNVSGDEMILRIANNGEFASTAKVTGQTISVTYDDGDSGVYLYVQGNDGNDWVASKAISSSNVYTLDDLGRFVSDDLSKCQVWLEKYNADHRLTYATYAEGGNHKGSSGKGGSGNGGSGNGNAYDYTGEDINFMAYLTKLLKADSGKKKATAKVEIDHDTFKSEAPAHTVIASETATDAFGLFDLKVHKPGEKTTANQEFLAKTLVGPNVQILLTQNIYPRRDLSTAENGASKKLTWNNLPKEQAGPVFAVVYNETDGAYVLNGTLDANGTAVFSGFMLRSASTVTICK